MGVSVDDVAEQGPGLAFVAYPEALLQMPVPQMWSILFFLMLFILGLGSQFAGIEAINTAIVDRWPHLRKNYWRVTAFTCFTCFILGIPMCFSGGVLQWYWKAVWTVIIPVASVAILAFIFSDWTAPSYEDYVFPLFADLLGWAVGLSTLALFPVGVGWALYHGYTRKILHNKL
ncbi:Transporter, partial [Operophtera brumata]